MWGRSIFFSITRVVCGARLRSLFWIAYLPTDTRSCVLLRDEATAIAIVRAHRDKSYSLCDALSFVVMEQLRIREAISFDQDFRSYGRFAVLS